MTYLNLTQDHLFIQAQANDCGSAYRSIEEPEWGEEAEQRARERYADHLEQQHLVEEAQEEAEWAAEKAWAKACDYLKQEHADSEPNQEPDWEEMAEQRNMEYAAALQEAQGIARHEKALDACQWVQGILRHPKGPLFQACVNQFIKEGQLKSSEPGASKDPYDPVESSAQWDQQVLGFIRTWICEQLEEQGFVKVGIDTTHHSRVVYETVFSDCWMAIYQFFIDRRGSIQMAIQQPRCMPGAKLSTSPKNTDRTLNFFTETMFEYFAKDWLLRLELDPQPIDTYLHEQPSRRLDGAKALWSLYESLIANNTFFKVRDVQIRDLMDDFVKAIEPESSFNDYAYPEHSKEIELSSGLRTLIQIISQLPCKNLF